MGARTGRIVLTLALLTVGSATFAAGADAGTPSKPLCFKVGTDVRAPYNGATNNGTCPAGFQLIDIAVGTAGPASQPACIKPSTDVRAPYNGTCPAGFQLVQLTLAPNDGVPVCVKPSTDFRSPYNNGTCPAGFAKRWLAKTASNGFLPTLSINDAQGDQHNGATPVNAVFTVTLSAPSAATVTVDYTTVPGTATECPSRGCDYDDATGTLTFVPGDTTETITVTVNDSSYPACEGTLTFVANLSNPVNATILDGQGQGTIVDSDDCSRLSINDATVGNTFNGGADVNAVFTVTLSTASAATVTVNYTTVPGTATECPATGCDYDDATGTLTFVPGDTTETITVTVHGTGAACQNVFGETFFVNLSNPVNAAIQDGQGQGNIVDQAC